MRPVDELSGRELDAAVAEEVMGHVEVFAPIGDGLTRTNTYGGRTLKEASDRIREAYKGDPTLREPYYYGPTYSGDIGQAWKVVEKIHADGGQVEVNTPDDEGDWSVFVWADREWSPDVVECAPTAPLAICRAALTAVRTKAEYGS